MTKRIYKMFKRALLALVLALAFCIANAATGGFSATAVQIAPSASKTATYTSADQTNSNWGGVIVFINTSAFVSGTFTPSIQAKDPVSGNYYTILTGAAISGTGLVTLKVHPSITAVVNASVADVLPLTWRVVMTGATTPSATFSIGAVLIP